MPRCWIAWITSSGDIERRGYSPDFELFYLILEYVRDFVDRYHHPKEDHYLFKALRRRVPRGGANVL